MPGRGPVEAIIDVMDPLPRSSIPGLHWPAILDSRGSAMLALQFQLDRSQWWSPDELSRAQFRQLSGLLRHAAATVPYYEGRLAGAGIDTGEPLDYSRWSRIPVLMRRDVQAAGDRLLSTAPPPGHGRVHRVSTSGSTGTPVTVAVTDMAQVYWLAFNLRHRLWHQYDLGGKLAQIRHVGGKPVPFPNERHARGWGPATDHAFDTGPSVALSIMTPVAQQVEWLLREDPGVLVTYPTNLLSLLEYCSEHGVRLPRLQKVETIGEALSPEVREACRDTWGLVVIDSYTTQEIGYVALQCPEHEQYHVQSEGVLVEVLDDDGRQCQPGQTGQVVITPLHNFATPLIRYFIGDYATVGGPCPCGRGLPVLERILGRVRNRLTLPSGEKIWPTYGAKRFAEVAPVRQFQVVQKSLEELEIRLVPTAPLTPAHEAAVRGVLEQSFGGAFRYEISYHAEIPRSAGGKFEDFRSELPD